MASNHSYTITLSNNNTEKQGIKYVTENDPTLFEVNSEMKNRILELLDIDKKYNRSFDLIKVNLSDVVDGEVVINNSSEIILVELKTTQKKLVNFPKGFFFGATENEFTMAEKLGDRYQFCFVSLHEESRQFNLLTLSELEKLIKNKRIQYQINL